jgi:hypothetical protein
VTPLPNLHVTPRVSRDIARCLRFIARQPRGKPADRLQDILKGIQRAREQPDCNRIRIRRPPHGLPMRRQDAAQFAIIYVYFSPSARNPVGRVSIRAVRHRRVTDVFHGVRESGPKPYGAPDSSPAMVTAPGACLTGTQCSP